MEAERLAAIRRVAEAHAIAVRPRQVSEDCVRCDLLELLDLIDALQAENQQLRDAAVTVETLRLECSEQRAALQAENERLQQTREDDLVYAGNQEAKLRAENTALRERVTLLEGLLGRAQRVLPWKATALIAKIDAALSRSDQNTSDG